MGKMSKAQAGRLGGNATKSAHGSGYFKKIGAKGGRKGGRSLASKYGSSYMKKIGARGGRRSVGPRKKKR